MFNRVYDELKSQKTFKLDNISEINDCSWYTYVPDDYFCNILMTCTEINVDTCENCVSGENFNRAVIKFQFGPLVVNLDTSSMYFLCKILNSIMFCLMTKSLQSVKIFETGLNIFARPNITQLKNLHRAGI